MRFCGGFIVFVLLAGVGPVASAIGASPPPAPTATAGTIASVGPNAVTLTTTNGPRHVRLTAATRVMNWVPAALADIKTGQMVGIAARKEMNGTLTAVEIHIFPAGRQVAARQFPWVNGTIMTNAPVTSLVSAVSARTITVSYDGRPVTIKIEATTDIRRVMPGTRDELRPGRRVIVLGPVGADGSVTANVVIVSQGR